MKKKQPDSFELQVTEETKIIGQYVTERSYAMRCDNEDIRHSIVTFFGKENNDDTTILFMRKPNTHFLIAEKPVELSKFKSYRVDVFTGKQLGMNDKLFLMVEGKVGRE